MANVGLLFEKSRDFSWTDEQRKNAFANAKYTFDTDEQFQDIPDDQVKKIKRGKISPTCWSIQQSIDTNSIHSFIKIENQVYATLAKQKGGLLGKGSFGTVRLAIDENGKQHAIKIENTSNGYDDPKIFQKNEVMINYDLGNGISKNVSYRYQPKTVPQKHEGEIISQQGKYYSVQKMLGMNLYEFLKINQDSLTDQQRLKLALQVCKLVEQLHLGTHSKEQKPFAHCDIKPENFTIDRNFKVTLVDFGLSTTEINTLPKGLRGTPEYLPQNYKQTTHQAHDIFALKRSLFCSERSSDIDGKSLLGSGLEETSILTRQFLQKYPALKKMISTFKNLAYQDDNIQDIYAQLRGIEEQLSATADDKEVSTFTDTNGQTPTSANNLTTYLNRPLSKQDDFQPSRFPSERRIFMLISILLIIFGGVAGLWLSMVCPISCIPSPINMLSGLLIGIIVVSSLIATTIHFLDNPSYSQVFIDSQKQYDSQYLESAKLAQSEPKDDLQDINSDCQDTNSDLPQFTASLSTTL